MSDVHAHFAQLGLTSDMYMVDWCVSKSQLQKELVVSCNQYFTHLFMPAHRILTVLCKSAPMDVAVRIWDAYFVYGDYFLYRMALGLCTNTPSVEKYM